MENFNGFLLRQERIKKNYSQEGICRGICTPSYLCKIEQGKATPSQDILVKLFNKLDIQYCTDQELLFEAKKYFEMFFSMIEVEEDINESRCFFDSHHKELETSELHIEYHLYSFYTYINESPIQAQKEKSYLEKIVSYMNENLKAYFYYFCAILIGKNRAAISYLKKAIQLFPTSYYYYYLGTIQFHIGDYEECVVNSEKAYRLASEDGNPYVLISSSFLLGSCHCFYHNQHSAKLFYERSIGLTRGYKTKVKDYAYYNLATSYLEVENYKEALYYFNKVEYLDEDVFHMFIYYQKLAYLYLKMNNKVKAEKKIYEMKKMIDKLDKNVDLYQTILENLEAMMEENYLNNIQYENTLKYLYDNVEDILGYGLKRFYAIQSIELLKTQRRYKEALKISETMKIS